MIELTEQQRPELEAEPPRAIDPLTQKVYVLVSEDVYDRIRDLLVPERLTSEEQRSALRAAGLCAGWDDPQMDVYCTHSEMVSRSAGGACPTGVGQAPPAEPSKSDNLTGCL